jgi:hypothetical protein
MKRAFSARLVARPYRAIVTAGDFHRLSTLLAWRMSAYV